MTAAVHTANAITTQPTPKVKRKCCQREKVIDVALKIMFALLVGAMIIFQAPIFFSCLILGAFLKDPANQLFKRIAELWKERKGIVIGATIVISFFAFPVIFMTTAALSGAKTGVWLSEVTCRKKKK